MADNRPTSVRDLFWSFSFLALQGFGGVMAVVQREMVERKKWLTAEEFLEDWAVAQILPGPNVVNLALVIGDRHFGFRGAMAAVGGMLAIPTVIILAIAVLYAGVADLAPVQGALRGMGAVAAGLITITGLKLVPALRANPMGKVLCAALIALTFGAIAVLRVPLVWVLLVLGGGACLWTYRCLGVVDSNKLPAEKDAP
jgi:chromate transporter